MRKRRGLRSGAGATSGQRTVLIETHLLDELGRAGAKRGISANEMVRRLVETCVDDGLIDAVLDDSADCRKGAVERDGGVNLNPILGGL